MQFSGQQVNDFINSTVKTSGMNRKNRWMARKAGVLFMVTALLANRGYGQGPSFHVLAFYTSTVENDHVDFANNIIPFYRQLALRDNFSFDTTTNWSNLNDEVLKKYEVVVWINEFAQNEPQRRSFENFINRGGAWLGFHVSAYNDKYTKWPWFVEFLGGAVFYNNNWPPLPAKLIVDDNRHPVTKGMPRTYISPINEWYTWRPSARLNKDVKVLVSLDPSNYPLGKKNLITEGDCPVVWTNTKYNMLYMNMGHGDKVVTDSLQNEMFARAILWLGGKH
jgi:uncharacterized protein